MRLAARLAAATVALGISSSFAAAATRTLPLSASGQAVSADETNFTVTSGDPVYSDYDSHTTTWAERRAVFEFDLADFPSGAAILTAYLHITVSDVHPKLNQSTLLYPDINFYGYAGNNVAEDADADRRDASLGGEKLNDVGPWEIFLDPDQIQIYANSHAAAVGIMAYPQSVDESVGFWTTGSAAPTIEITYTLFGDANLDDRITGDDYTLIDRGFALHLTGWSNGDFNDDGVINSADYLLIDQSFAAQGNPFSPEFLDHRSAQFGPEYVSTLLASVPEPASLSVVAIGALPLLSRRRRA